MDAYHHITPTERGRIMTLFKQGHSPAAIAAELNRHKSTILRELKRNRDGESYNADKAQEKYDNRRQVCLRNEIDPPLPYARPLPVFTLAFLRPAPAVNVARQHARFIHIKDAFLAQKLYQPLHLPSKAFLGFFIAFCVGQALFYA